MSSITNYENLANAIILQAVKDYRTALKCMDRNPNNRNAQSDKEEVERFFRSQWYRNAQSDKEEVERFFRSQWYSALTSVDGEMLIRSLQEEVGA